ncbi:DUF3618 domain-containing protein [Micromonospora sp. NPDC053740]|uniref:Ribosome biogenesis protein Nip4 n=1 Tax=Micromonospora ureilytica TaxID=709868 RepID=A0ABS0JHM7_9ACTN|nr:MULTISPECIES: DUF3618 domain-containing protein [Micromonospora]WSZ80079.1 DUF3618 domain-containing protein [Micromonospora sp. NBC_00860]WTI10412.1 DUF3618 domain-containing protein [Micromonospora sp. NBC_00821]MBG6066575.1 ribosome biogenesis protein Nip4 [Micromonospora ureilytica]MCG5466170.1 DUF3618 domain-containing protein [Micromonospora alfalfae]MCX5117501.1 DUF3618 domain-containing protein [Micromonospora sp. NBC_00362]
MTGNGTGDTEALREEIRRTRVELGETMEALAAKADVKARLKESAEQAKERMREQAAQTVARVRGQAARGAGMARAQAYEKGELVRAQAYDKGELVRRNPVPWAAIAAGAVATVVVLMIVRGRRR